MTKRIIKKAAIVGVPGVILYVIVRQPIIITLAIMVGTLWVVFTELKCEHQD